MVDVRLSGGSQKIGQQLGDVPQRWDVLEAAIGERRPVVALGGRQPADVAVQAVIVVVTGVLENGGLGRSEIGDWRRSRTSACSVAQIPTKGMNLNRRARRL